MIPFVKMHSLGNDIIILPQDTALSDQDIRMISHRRYGIGCDQVMGLGSRLRIWNQDGTYALACGNGTRCVIAYLNPPYEEKVVLEGPVGPLTGWKSTDGLIHVQQGSPRVGSIVHKTRETLVNRVDLTSYGYTYGVPVTIGNPHLIIPGVPPEPCSSIWQALAQHPAFPEGVNVSFVYQSTDICVSTWERGVGLTLGCGSAACAVAFVLFQNPSFFPDGLVASSLNSLSLRMPGGKILVYCTDQGLVVHAAPVSQICWGWWQKDHAQAPK